MLHISQFDVFINDIYKYIYYYYIIVAIMAGFTTCRIDPGRVSGTEAVVVVGDRMCVSGVCVC